MISNSRESRYYILNHVSNILRNNISLIRITIEKKRYKPYTTYYDPKILNKK